MKVVLLERLGASLVLVASLSLSACGGGGGGDTTPTPPPAAKTLTITAPKELAVVEGDGRACVAVKATASDGAVTPALAMSDTPVFGKASQVAKATLANGQLCLASEVASDAASRGDVLLAVASITASAAGYDPITANVNLVFTGVTEISGRSIKALGKFPIVNIYETYSVAVEMGGMEMILPDNVSAASVKIVGVENSMSATFRDEDWTSLGLGVLRVARQLKADSPFGCWEAVGKKVWWFKSCKASLTLKAPLKGEQKVVILGSDDKEYIFRFTAELGSWFNPESVKVGDVVILTSDIRCIGEYASCFSVSEYFGSIGNLGFHGSFKSFTAYADTENGNIGAAFDNGYITPLSPLPGS